MAEMLEALNIPVSDLDAVTAAAASSGAGAGTAAASTDGAAKKKDKKKKRRKGKGGAGASGTAGAGDAHDGDDSEEDGAAGTAGESKGEEVTVVRWQQLSPGWGLWATRRSAVAQLHRVRLAPVQLTGNGVRSASRAELDADARGGAAARILVNPAGAVPRCVPGVWKPPCRVRHRWVSVVSTGLFVH